MADVNIEMKPGRMTVESDEMPRTKARKLDLASAGTWAKLRELEARKHEAAENRGPWKDAGREQRAEAKEIAGEIAEVKRQLVAEHEAAKAAEAEKQAAAAERERALRGDA